MKQQHILLKVVVVVSAVLLTGSVVSFRAGAFNWFGKPSAQPVDSDSTAAEKPIIQPADPKVSSAQEAKAPDENKPLIIMQGTKSPATGGGILGGLTPAGTFTPDITPPPASTPQQQPPPALPPTIIPSPKAGPIFVPEPRTPDLPPLNTTTPPPNPSR